MKRFLFLALLCLPACATYRPEVVSSCESICADRNGHIDPFCRFQCEEDEKNSPPDVLDPAAFLPLTFAAEAQP